MITKTHWQHAILIFALTFLAAGILLPLIRVQPRAFHEYFNGLNDWVRIIATFAMCVTFTGVLFKLLSPQIGHLEHCRAYPPAWLAALLAWIVVAIVDLCGGFDTDGYRANAGEWLGYGLGSILVVGLYSGLWKAIYCKIVTSRVERDESTECVTLQDIENAPWEEIEAWLESDEPARYDFLGNQSVAHRVSILVSEGTRSVGIVGPFGAGKTSIVSWVKDRLKRREVNGRKYFVSHHSCWGFETSASAIHVMLNSALAKVSEKIDTFQVDSLPDSYRQTFSAGGDWIETISNMVLDSPEPMDQFSRLSDLLRSIDGRLIFIVEDLDRNETRNFEIQEVLAFLERLKEHSNFSFVLTGGLSSSQHIDYAKLCDHIEFLRTIQPHHSSGLIKRVSQWCLNNTVYPHIQLSDPNRNYEWNPLNGMLMRDLEEFSLPQAAASLLNTPRSLRHALGRTVSAWRTLHGEIDYNHLLAVNILRFGAPECFQFLLRRWERIHSSPSQQQGFRQERLRIIRRAILNDWNHTIERVEWDPAVALAVMKFILPSTEYWLVNDSHQGHSQNGRQHVSEERYWNRAINDAIDADDVRDQEVIRDIQTWLDAPNMASELVTKLTTLPHYANIWENLAEGLFANRQDVILHLCEQVIQRILADQGAIASGHSQGFIHTWRFASPKVFNLPNNKRWLQDRISEAAATSIEMVNGLWHFYGNPGKNSILRNDEGKPVRQHVHNIMKNNLSDAPSLIARLTPNNNATLLQLIFDRGNESVKILADVPTWAWLGCHILTALRNRNIVVAANCVVLLGSRVSGRERMTVDTEVLDHFFGDDASEVIDIIESMIDQVPEADQLLVRNVVGAARQHLSGAVIPKDDNQNSDVDEDNEMSS